MKRWGLVLAAALALAPAMAAAREPSIWAQCDGQAKPEGTGVTAARIAAVALGSGFLIGLAALPESPTGADRAVGQAGVDACTAALADPIIENFWPRKINVLRARALNYAQLQRYDLALADLRAARAVGEGKPAQAAFDRSVGVSVLLFEAALLARNGESDNARALAIRAADARPYASGIQRSSLAFFADTPTLTPEEARIQDRLARFTATPSLLRAYRLNATTDAVAAADAWEAALTAGARSSHLRVGNSGRRIEVFEGDDPVMLARTAIAVARAGRVERAAALRERLTAALAPPAAAAAPAAAPTPAQTTRSELFEARIEQAKVAAADRRRREAAALAPLLDAQILFGRGDAAGALALVQREFSRLPKERAAVDLLEALARTPEGGAQLPAFVIAAFAAESRPDVAKAWRERDLVLFARTLPQFQRVDGGNRYRPQGPPGFRNGIGYLDEEVEGGAKIAYGGAPGVDARDEMLLLRAAELTAAAGRPAFDIEANADGAMTVKFVGEAGADSYLVADVIAALKPIYVDLPAEIDAARGDRRR